MRKLTIGLVVVLLGLFMALMTTASAGEYGTTTTGNNDPCDEYHETRHPECQTTTTNQQTTTTGQSSTTTSEVTTTTNEQTTTTQPETTTSFTQQTTTTVKECADGFIHQPPLCVEVTTTLLIDDTTTTVIGPVPMDPPEELPFTGIDTTLIAAVGLVALVGGAGLKRLANR